MPESASEKRRDYLENFLAKKLLTGIINVDQIFKVFFSSCRDDNNVC